MQLCALHLLSILSMLAAPAASKGCPNGYAINGTAAVFTELLETDFLHLHNLTYGTHAPAWLPQAYSAAAQQSRGPYGKLAQPRNVVPNPLGSVHDWGGAGIRGGAPGLQLWVRSALAPAPSTPGSSSSGGDSGGVSAPALVPIAEIVSQRADVLYGSFRIALRSPAANGTCAAFFTYADDASEIDIELLSRQQQNPSSSSSFSSSSSHPSNNSSAGAGAANLVIQSPQSAALGYVPPTSPDFALAPLPFSPAATYTEFRVDWLPAEVRFFANSRLLAVMRANVPARPARLHVIHWSNGNAGWSGGPPATDAALVVSYVKAYFNSSSSAAAAATVRAAAIAAGGPMVSANGGSLAGGVCVVPDVFEPPDPMGPHGNVTGRTFFFSDPLVDGSETPGTKSAATRLAVEDWQVLLIVILVVRASGMRERASMSVVLICVILVLALK